MHEIIRQAMEHKGYALIDVLQPCVTFNKLNTFAFFKERVYKLDEDETYDTTDREMARKRAEDWHDRIAIGVFYKNPDMPVYEDSIQAIQSAPLVQHDISNVDVSPLFEELV